MKQLSVVVGIPGPDIWDAKFAMSVIAMVADFGQNAVFPHISEHLIRVFHKKGSILPQLRQELVEEALSIEATHLLFLDSDQTFPPDTLRRLLLWERPVVACNIATKRFPSDPTARRFNGTLQGELVYTREGDIGLERVWRVGCGVMLVDLTIFARLPKPWFLVDWYAEHNKFGGEDWHFCKVLEDAGYWIYIDHELSLDVGHRGFFEYKHDSVQAGRVWREQQKALCKDVSVGTEGEAAQAAGGAVKLPGVVDGKGLIVVPNGPLIDQLTCHKQKEAFGENW